MNSQTYTTSGTYTEVVGCTTHELVLTINTSGTITATETACDSYTWPINSQTYTTSGTYTEVVGCTTHELVLTINTSGTNSTSITACDSYLWPINSQTYTTSGTYAEVVGCTTHELVLTLTQWYQLGQHTAATVTCGRSTTRPTPTAAPTPR
ncbi:MAG: hypothetical protein IPO17_12615 [Flavobacteriales bacterium]|nr:hypothetical protein [Flavobacteriales bacterium]